MADIKVFAAAWKLYIDIVLYQIYSALLKCEVAFDKMVKRHAHPHEDSGVSNETPFLR